MQLNYVLIKEQCTQIFKRGCASQIYSLDFQENSSVKIAALVKIMHVLVMYICNTSVSLRNGSVYIAGDMVWKYRGSIASCPTILRLLTFDLRFLFDHFGT